MAILKTGDVEVPVDVTETGTGASPLTGRALRTYTATLQISDPSMKDGVRSALQDSAAATLTLDGVDVECTRGIWSTSEQEGYPTMSVSVDLTEREDLTPTAVTIGALTLHPTRYEESLNDSGDDKRTILMTVVLDSESTSLLREHLRMEEPFEIIRHGLNDDPITMWAGNAVHSLNDDGTTKTRFALVQPSERRSNFFDMFITMLDKAIKLAADERRRSNDLLRLLNEKGVLSDADTAALKTPNEDAEREIRYTFSEVKDADDSWL